MLLLAFALLGGPARCLAEESLPQAKKKVLIDAVGDARFTADIKMPARLYTIYKSRTPNLGVLLREMGLSHEGFYEMEDIKADFDDAGSTLRCSWRVRGLARQLRDHTWEVSAQEYAGLEQLLVTDKVGLFKGTDELPSWGEIPLLIQYETPPGSRQLRLLHSPSRLTYRLPASSGPQGTRTTFDFDLQVKAEIMSCLAKSHGNPKFAKLWVARTVLKNTGDRALPDFRVRFRIHEYAPTWSAWQRCCEVLPGQTVVDVYFPVFDLEKLSRLSSSCRDALEVEYQYRGADGRLVEESDSRTIQILGRNEVIFSSLKPEHQLGWQDTREYAPWLHPSFVTKDDPIIQQVAGWVSGQAGGVDAALSDASAVKFLHALYDFMAYNRIAYQTSPSAVFNGQFGQHYKYGRDVLQNRAGTCVDLAIFYASVCEAVGLQPILYTIPGHVFPAIRLPESPLGKEHLFFVETTAVGHARFEAAKPSSESFAQIEKGIYKRVDIVRQHDAGVYGLQLPPLPPSALSDWGIRPVPLVASGGAVPAWLVGTWKCSTTLERKQVDSQLEGKRLEIIFSFTRDGTYESRLRFGDDSDRFTGWSKDQGAFQVGIREFVLAPSSGQADYVRTRRDYVREGGYLWLTYNELHLQLPFAKAEPAPSTREAAPVQAASATWAPAPPAPQWSAPSGTSSPRGGSTGRQHHGGGRRR
jgi:hypothetical protein